MRNEDRIIADIRGSAFYEQSDGKARSFLNGIIELCQDLRDKKMSKEMEDLQEYLRREKKENEEFEPIWKRMTSDEQRQLLVLSVGLPDNNGDPVLFGMISLNRLKEFRAEMVKKYSK